MTTLDEDFECLFGLDDASCYAKQDKFSVDTFDGYKTCILCGWVHSIESDLDSPEIYDPDGPYLDYDDDDGNIDNKEVCNLPDNNADDAIAGLIDDNLPPPADFVLQAQMNSELGEETCVQCKKEVWEITNTCKICSEGYCSECADDGGGSNCDICGEWVCFDPERICSDHFETENSYGFKCRNCDINDFDD